MSDMLEHIAEFVSLLGRGMLDLLAPPREPCLFCGRPAAGGVCAECDRKVPRVVAPFCRVCGRPMREGTAHLGQCLECLGQKPYFVRARAVAVHDGLPRQAIHGLKYGGQVRLAPRLAQWMAEAVRNDPVLRQSRVVVPVPLHPDRWLERGYNHAELLSAALSDVLRLPHEPNVLRRVKATERQSELSREARLRNMRGAFETARPALVAGRMVLLVDDVLTSGSTASECARALLKSGCSRVGVVTLTVAPFERSWVTNRVP